MLECFILHNKIKSKNKFFHSGFYFRHCVNSRNKIFWRRYHGDVNFRLPGSSSFLHLEKIPLRKYRLDFTLLKIRILTF